MHPRGKKLISAFSNRVVKGKESLETCMLISIDLSNAGLQVNRWGNSEIDNFFFSIFNDCLPCLACHMHVYHILWPLTNILYREYKCFTHIPFQ